MVNMAEKSSNTLLLAGDAILAKPWSKDQDPRFLRLVEEIRAADVAAANLEIVLDDFQGHPQVDSGGIHLSAEGSIAKELRWAGFQMLGFANNHSFDYGSTGLLRCIDNVHAAGLLLAGAGGDLSQALAPCIHEDHGRRVALLAATTCLESYARAGRSRFDMNGRPGVNPLHIPVGEVVDKVERRLCGLADTLGAVGVRWPGFRIARPKQEDVAANLNAIESARAECDWLAFSLHTHIRGAWRQRFARQAIDHGADTVFTHGRHYVQGVEIYKGRPIFYGLGSIAFELNKVERHAAQTYDFYGFEQQTTPQQLNDFRYQRESYRHPRSWRGIAARITWDEKSVQAVDLIPLDLRQREARESVGRPRWADPKIGAEIIGEVARLSKRYGCRMEYDTEAELGRVKLD